jgi:hypothetical protein
MSELNNMNSFKFVAEGFAAEVEALSAPGCEGATVRTGRAAMHDTAVSGSG